MKTFILVLYLTTKTAFQFYCFQNMLNILEYQQLTLIHVFACTVLIWIHRRDHLWNTHIIYRVLLAIIRVTSNCSLFPTSHMLLFLLLMRAVTNRLNKLQYSTSQNPCVIMHTKTVVQFVLQF